jgi:peptidoglycan/xylan/chitin deacetylase (PgdA/CDA1 family)/SAM-dependent methyltransferase
MYHSVRDSLEGGPYGIEITSERFERHIDFLTSRYRVVPLVEFIDALSSHARAEGMAAITFDDAFADNLDASAILRKYRAPATVFVPTGYVGRPYFWWDALARLWLAHSERFAAGEKAFRARFPELSLEEAKSQPRLRQAVWDRLRRLALDDVYSLVQELATQLGVALDGLPRPATEMELPLYAHWPLEIGAHAVSHRPMPFLTSEQLQDEVAASRRYLEERIGRPPATFSYPFGLSDRDARQAVRAGGFLGAVGVAEGPEPTLFYNDLFDLPRIDAGFCDIDEFAARMDRIEEKNAQILVKYRVPPPSPLEIGPERRSVGASAGSSIREDARLRGNDLFRTTPFARLWGTRRGIALDRPFIDQFIRAHAGDIRGRILEIKEPEYAQKYACPGAKIDILDIDPENTRADILDDLQSCSKIPSETYDCVILTQVLQLIPDVESAIASVARILKPGGVLLLTAPGITQTVCTNEGDFLWSFFKPGIRRLLSPHFDMRRLLLESHGNAGLAASFLMGLTLADTPPELYAVEDREYPIVLTARAMKPLSVPEQVDWSDAIESPRVSVIIPMFNAEQTIKETLHSVSRQSYESYEVLIIDDGSTDGSPLLADELAGGSKGRITVLRHPGGVNRGLASSRNLGIRHAQGEFIVFLDSDDTIHPEKLAHDILILEAHPEAGAVVGRALWWWDGAGEQDAHLDQIMAPHDRLVIPPTYFHETYELRTGGVPPCVHSWMVRKSALAAIEPFDPEIMTYEDQKFLAELSLRFPIYVASACLCEYRRKEVTLWATAVASGTDEIAYARFEKWTSEVRGASPGLKGST